MITQLANSRSKSYGSVEGGGLVTRWVYISCCALVLIFVGLCVRLAPALTLVVAACIVIAFALPGVILATVLFGRDVRKSPETLIYGAAAGLAISEYGATMVGYTCGWSVLFISLTLLALILAALVIAWQLGREPIITTLKPWTATDYLILIGTWIVLTLFVAVPYLNVGRLTPDGYAYTWLFGFDFLLRSAIANSVTLGLPPDYLHLSGEPLRYYLSSYTLPAFAYSASGKSVPMHGIMLVQQLLLGYLLLGCLFCFMRRFISSARALACTSFTVVLFYSYYGWYPIVKKLIAWLALPLPASVTNPATNSTYGGMSHLYQRLFLVEPQAMTGVCVFLLVMFLLEAVGYKLKGRFLAVVLGALLGIEFGIEGWQALVLVGWFGLTMAWILVRRWPDVRDQLLPLSIIAVLCAAVYVSFFAVGVYQLSSGKALLVAPYMWAIKHAPVYFPVEYGPMFVLGVWGVCRQWKRDRGSLSAPLLILVLVSLVQIFFVTAAVLPEFGLLRGNRILPIALLVWTGYLLDSMSREKSRKAIVAVCALLVLALPTVLTDVHYSSNIFDRDNTRYVRVQDRQACDWIKNHIPETAVVQNEPNYIGQNSVSPRAPVEMSLIANFAERRMAIGEEWIASTVIVDSRETALRRLRDIHQMFRARDIDTVSRVASRNRIDYVYVGPYEQKLYPGFLGTIRSATADFREVYSSDAVHIFQRISTSSLASLKQTAATGQSK